MKASYKKNCAVAVILLLLVAAFYYSGLSNSLTLENFKNNTQSLEGMVSEHYLLSVLIFISIYILVVAITLPVSAFLTLAGGFLFGAFPALVYSIFGGTVGAICSFLISRYVLGLWLQKRYARKLARFNEVLEKQGSTYLLMLHLLTVVPFLIINILAGLTKVSVWTFAWTTAVGILPGAFVFAFAGKQIHEIEKVQDVLSWNILFLFACIGCLALIPALIRRFKKSPELEMDGDEQE